MGPSELRVVVHATQMSVGSPAGRVVTLMVSLSPIHRPVMALHMRPVYTVLLGHGQRGLLGGRVPVPVAPVHAQKSDLWRPIRLNDTEDVHGRVSDCGVASLRCRRPRHVGTSMRQIDSVTRAMDSSEIFRNR